MQNMVDINMVLLQWFIIFLIKKTFVSAIKMQNISNKELVEESKKPITIKFNKRKVHSPFKDNIWGVDLADMQQINKFNEGFKFSLCAIDIYSKYAWVIPSKDKKGIPITNAFHKILDELKCKRNIKYG